MKMAKYERDLEEKFEIIDQPIEVNLFKKLIRNWHEKATTEDYFSKFVFEYLSFNAIIRKYVDSTSNRDREAIQRLKMNYDLKQEYLEKTNGNKELEELLTYLKENPLEESEDLKWWNCSQLTRCSDNRSGKRKRGSLRNVKDWENIVELIYYVRNHLFHGGKDPENERDQYLVEHAYKLLRPLVEILLKKIRLDGE